MSYFQPQEDSRHSQIAQRMRQESSVIENIFMNRFLKRLHGMIKFICFASAPPEGWSVFHRCPRQITFKMGSRYGIKSVFHARNRVFASTADFPDGKTILMQQGRKRHFMMPAPSASESVVQKRQRRTGYAIQGLNERSLLSRGICCLGCFNVHQGQDGSSAYDRICEVRKSAS